MNALNSMAGKLTRSHKDLWGHERVDSNGGEINEVTEGFAILQMELHRDFWAYGFKLFNQYFN
jgi:hypothetical protein